MRRLRSFSRATRRLAAGAALAGLALVAGCSNIDYYAQSVQGQWAVLQAARPLDEVIADPDTAPALKQRLERAREMRAFASDELALPRNRSYTSYADLGRPYVVWNVFATPELSLRLRQWCYPVVGCAGYRGYFAREDAEAAAAALRAEGLDVSVSGVPAYSTLGWFPDPLLNTFIGGTEGQVAGLIFHELAHQVVFVGGDTTFNESFATAVEREGVRRWLAVHGTDGTRRGYAEFTQRRAGFLELLLRYRGLLAANYASDASDEAKRARKKELFAELQADYQRLKAQWGGFAGYDRYFAQDLGNAQLAAVGAYNDLVPAFDLLLAQAGGKMPVFFEEVQRIAALPKAERDQLLRNKAESAHVRVPGLGL